MIPSSAIAIFCEDIREELGGGRFTIVGTFPDSINVANAPKAPAVAVPVIPKLCLYIRANFDPVAKIGPVSWKMTMPDGTERSHEVKQSVIEAAQSKAIKRMSPVAGIVSRSQMSPFAIPEHGGRLTVEVTIGDQTFICGTLNLNIEPEQSKEETSSTASPPPS